MLSPVTDAPTTRDTFLEAVRAADVLTPSQQTKARALAPPGPADSTADALVAAGLLTRFQADRLLSGRTDGFLLGPYTVLEQIGRGTLSRVYKAKHRTMNRPVAIKVLAAALTRTRAEREAFQREVRAAGKLAHPNIVTAVDAGDLHDRCYLVLEFVDGPNLEALVRQRGPLPVAQACEFVRQTAAGLHHAHEKGLVHRDLKPTNLMVVRPTPSAPLTVKIADFGVPKDGTEPTAYSAPELSEAAAAPAAPRADLYALGGVFYFLLTGRPPEGDGTVPLSQCRPDVPPEVAAIVHRLLERSPALRVGSAEELLYDLDAVCVPVAVPLDGAVDFDAPAPLPYPGQDTGYLTGRNAIPTDVVHPLPGSGAYSLSDAVPSPWEQITNESDGDTMPLEPDATPTPRTMRRPKPTGRGESVPLWVTASLLVSIVLVCLMSIGAIAKMLLK
ncbi:serine/threonine-protein kinase [Frigoriglobus tundricola]|uniref:Serine/threonine protein kinase n=1 Tax=Frigoriglobus tundricola TaxID=2774151 RepID=A0A6M5YM40_9BACT|nr:serine/threonine-protein kinase [Frigoriglobus tundricola]QJW94022.1 Serine/threonine protein kinase [Frigoriglobus tundricola]